MGIGFSKFPAFDTKHAVASETTGKFLPWTCRENIIHNNITIADMIANELGEDMKGKFLFIGSAIGTTTGPTPYDLNELSRFTMIGVPDWPSRDVLPIVSSNKLDENENLLEIKSNIEPITISNIHFDNAFTARVGTVVTKPKMPNYIKAGHGWWGVFDIGMPGSDEHDKFLSCLCLRDTGSSRNYLEPNTRKLLGLTDYDKDCSFWRLTLCGKQVDFYKSEENGKIYARNVNSIGNDGVAFDNCLEIFKDDKGFLTHSNQSAAMIKFYANAGYTMLSVSGIGMVTAFLLGKYSNKIRSRL